MMRIIWLLHLIAALWAYPLQNPFQYLYPLAYPSSTASLDYNPYALPYIPHFEPYRSNYINDQYLQSALDPIYSPPSSNLMPTLNIMAELPYSISNEFSMVPMFVVSKDTLNMVTKGQITSISKDQPIMTIKAKSNASIECTPAVRMVLERPIIVGSLKSDILFPSEVQILHEGIRIPVRIGAVIAPVLPEAVVSPDSPLSIRVVYAVPTKPIKITITIEQAEETTEIPENAENTDAMVAAVQEAVVVESEAELPPKNVTVVDFPKEEAKPIMDVEGENAELVNRNPPLFLVPAGIVSSSQPIIHEQIFHNDKESPLLEALREPSKIKNTV